MFHLFVKTPTYSIFHPTLILFGVVTFYYVRIGYLFHPFVKTPTYFIVPSPQSIFIAQSAGAVEYTDYFAAEGKDPPTPPNEFPGYDTKQSYSDVPVMLEHWEVRSTSSLPTLPGPLWLRVVGLDRVLTMDQIELNCVLMLN